MNIVNLILLVLLGGGGLVAAFSQGATQHYGQIALGLGFVFLLVKFAVTRRSKFSG